MISASLRTSSGSCAGVNQHSSVDFYEMTKSDLLAGFCLGALLLEGGVSIPRCGWLWQWLDQQLLTELLPSENGLISFSSSKIPNVNIVETTQEDPKDLIPISLACPPIWGKRKSVYGYNHPNCRSWLVPLKSICGQFFVSFFFLTHFIFSVLRFVHVQKTNISFCS